MTATILAGITTPDLIADDARRVQTLGIPDDVAVPLRTYVHALNNWQAKNARDRHPHLIRGWFDMAPDDRPAAVVGELAEWFDLDPDARGGGRYIRIVAMRRADRYRVRPGVALGDPVSEHVHSFVGKTTGDVYKPAGYSGPAKGVRYSLTDDDVAPGLAAMLDRLDGYGGYLYANRTPKPPHPRPAPNEEKRP